jgi:hypothetical protein
MLDTIILQIPREGYEIIEHEKFIPRTTRMMFNTLPYFKYVNNPMAKDKSRKIYFPKMTIYKRGRNYDLTIEFSAPKILFNNNLNELEDKDFDEVARLLQAKIFTMGVKINLNTIKNAAVIAFHPSKNIVIKNGYTASFAIRELAKIDIGKQFDISKIKFKNGGQELQFYTNSHSFVFYDKIADLEIPEKRSVDKLQTKYQRSLLDYLKDKNKLEILRFEIRLSKKVKMNEILEKVGHSPNPSFKDVFNAALCRKIAKLYWDTYFSDNKFLFSICDNSQEIFQKIIRCFPKTKNATAIKMVGLYMLCKDELGMRGFRQIIDGRRAKKTNWEAVRRDFKRFDDEVFTKPSWGFVDDIEKALNNPTPFKANTKQFTS